LSDAVLTVGDLLNQPRPWIAVAPLAVARLVAPATLLAAVITAAAALGVLRCAGVPALEVVGTSYTRAFANW
jgi:hypothetical protein